MSSFKQFSSTFVRLGRQFSPLLDEPLFFPCKRLLPTCSHTPSLLSNSSSSSLVPRQLISGFHQTAVNMEEAIKAQGDLVRKLKSQKADKTLIKAEVDKLLALKSQAAEAGGGGGEPKDDAAQDGKKFILKCAKGKTRPDTRSISSRWRVGRGSTLRGRGSQSVGRGCVLGGQGLLCSELTNSANFT